MLEQRKICVRVHSVAFAIEVDGNRSGVQADDDSEVVTEFKESIELEELAHAVVM